jgi:hypothetical protein
VDLLSNVCGFSDAWVGLALNRANILALLSASM